MLVSRILPRGEVSLFSNEDRDKVLSIVLQDEHLVLLKVVHGDLGLEIMVVIFTAMEMSSRFHCTSAPM